MKRPSPRRFACMFSLVLMGWLCSVAAFADACRDMVPATLSALVSRTFPDERLPTMDDTDEDSRAQDRHTCQLVTQGNFGGPHHKDLVLLLPSRMLARYRVVAAMHSVTGWQLTSITVQDGSFRSLEISPAPPGQYVHTSSYAFVPEPGVMEHFNARHDGFYLGVVDGGADAWFLRNGSWIRIHAID